MHKTICEINSCTGCGACMQICPRHCIAMVENNEGFLYPQIDTTQCINCNLCKKTCHVNSNLQKNSAEFYMCWNNDKTVLKNSSSGGAFSAIAKCVFDQNGIVFGAYQDFIKREVYHIRIDTYNDLHKIRMSKYSQSDIDDVYQQIKLLLLNDRIVLFCGTACQVAGLYNYLNHTSAKSKLKLLYTIDVLCHGVTSNKVVKAFLESKENSKHKKINQYYYRWKFPNKPWICGQMLLKFCDEKKYISKLGTDTFFLGFNHNIFLRESCYQCRYCGTERISDFTLADYWGCPKNSVPKEQMYMGVSIILFNTLKANSLFNALQKYMHIEKIKPDIAVANNLALTRPQKRPKIRDSFFEMLQKEDYDKLIKRIFKNEIIKAKIKNMFGERNIKYLKKVLRRG